MPNWKQALQLLAFIIALTFMSQFTMSYEKTYSASQEGSFNDIEPAWSPDGKFITFVSDRNGEMGLWLMNSDGSNLREITPPGIGMVTSPSWSPDSHQIGFMLYIDRLYELAIIRIDDLALRTVHAEEIKSGLQFAAYAVWDRTGCCITVTGVLNEQRDIWLVNLETLEADNLTDSGRIEYSIDWSPDGKNLIFSAFDINYLDNSLDLWDLTLADGKIRHLTENTMPDLGATWSPNGEFIAFATDLAGSRDIWLMNADGSNLTNLTPDSDFGDYSPSWSPDGCCITFTSNRTGHYSIWVLDLDTNSLTNITE